MKKDLGFWDINGNYVEDIQEINKMDMDKYFEELNEMANFKNFGEKEEEEKEIIIDGVDVAGCGYFCEYDEECSICGMGTDGEDTFCKYCKDNSNCYYKQLQKLQQENIKQKEMIDRQWKLLAECGVSAGGELKRVSYLLENLRKENAELKAKIKKYATINEQDTKDYAELKAENERLNRCLMEELHHEGNALRETIKYKQTLQEIKEFCKKEIEYFDNNDDYGQQADWIALLQIITKAEEE